jgi:hypothetical protein
MNISETKFTIAGLPAPPRQSIRVRIGKNYYLVYPVKGYLADITYEEVTNRGATSQRPYVIGFNRQYKTLLAAVAALLKERK